MKRTMTEIAMLALLVGTMSCGGSTEQAEPTTPEGTDSAQPETSGDEAGGGEAATHSWDDMDHEARATLMREVVMPRMTEAFQGYDAEAFATFTCATCHMENFQEVSFAMPNGLHPLNPENIPAMFTSDDEQVVALANFMMGTVTTGMAEILGEQPFDPSTRQGFGCLECHALAE